MKTHTSQLQNMIIKVRSLWGKVKIKPQQIEDYNPEDYNPEDYNPEDYHDITAAQDRNQVRGMSFIFWFAGVVVVYVGYLLYSSLELIYLIFTGYILSMATDKMITWFQKKTGSRGWGIFLSYFIFISVLLSGVLIMIPFLGGQIGEIGKIIIKEINQVQIQLQTQGLSEMIEAIKWLPELIKDNILASLRDQSMVNELQQLIQDNIKQIASTSSTYLQGAGGIAVNIISAVFSAFTQVGFVFTLAVLFSIEKESMMGLFRRVDRKYHSKRHHKVSQMYEKLGFWLSSQLLLCLFIFVMTLVGLLTLSMFGIKLPSIFSLAIIAGLTEMIPYIGPLLGSVPALLVGGINYGFTGFIWVGALFFVIQRCENNILIPWIMKKTLGVSSLLIFICMLLGASTLGFIGILLAVPIAIIISITTEE